MNIFIRCAESENPQDCAISATESVVAESSSIAWFMRSFLIYSKGVILNSTPKDSSNSYIPYIAEGDSPAGPFTLVDHIDSYTATDGTPLKDIENIETDNSYYYQRYMTFDPYQMSQAMENLGLGDMDATSDVLRAIDFHPYVDSATGDKYLYFNTSVNSYIMGIKMNSWTEPDYSTLTIIAKPGYSTPSAAEKDVPNEMNTSVNEAAWITEHNGKYYLTYSTNSYKDKTYQVCQAVADSPLGEFRKLTEEEGGILLSADAALRDDVSGTGHSSIINAGGQYYIVYHKHNSVSEGGSSRHVAVDEIEWITVKDAQGNDLDVMYANGPTTSVQPLPEFASEYKNVASEAEVSATSLADDSSVSCLTDGLLSVNRFANDDMVETYVKETCFTAETTITLTFDDYKTIRALMIYNSKNMESAFYNIERVEFDCRLEDGTLATKYIDGLVFDWDAYTSTDDIDVIRPAASAIAEFDEIECIEIRITISPATEEQIPVHGYNDMAELAVSEIRVLGK